MNLKQAQYVKTIAECGSIDLAFAALESTSPSLAYELLEQETGLPIFDRSTSPMRLTYAGEKYLHAAERILAANAELDSQLREIRHEHAGRLRLGISVTRAMQVMPLVMPIFQQQYPNVSLQMTESGSANLEEMLRGGSIDLAFAALESTSPSLAYELLEQETIGVLAGRDAAVTRQNPNGTALSLEAFRRESFVSLTKGHSSRITQDKLFRKYGLSPNILLETDALEVGRRVALEAGACMLLPSIYIDGYCYQRKGCFYPLADYENHRHFYACYRKDEFVPQYARDFIQITASALARHEAQRMDF